MATYEENTLIKVYDKRGDCHIQYPKTKVSQVIGLEDKISEIQESTKVTDTYGIAGTAGASVKPQNMFNAVGNFMKNSAITTSNFLTNFKARLKNSLDTTDEGYALDARQGKTLKTNIDNVSGDLSNLNSTVQGINGTVTSMGNTITTMQDAIEAIEESSSVMKAAKITLPKADWNNKKQTITVKGIISENDMAIFICPLASYSEEFVSNNVLCISQATDTLVFQCDTVPTKDIVVYLVIKSTTTEEDIEHLEIILSEAYEVIQTIRGQNTTATTNISSLQSQNNTASSNISALTSLNQTASTRIDDLTNGNTEASSILSSLESANAVATGNISDLETANNTASTNISDLETANSTASENITDLATENTSATSNIASLGTANTNATNNIHTLTDLNGDAEQNISDINTANADAQDTLGHLSAMNNTANQTYENLSTANDSAMTITNSIEVATQTGNTLYTNITSANTTASDNISNLNSLNSVASDNITDLGVATQDGQDVLDELTAMNTTAGTTLGNLTTAEQTARDTITQLDLDNKLDIDGDSENVTTTFTSADVESASATAYTDPGVLTSGETHKGLFGKISQIAKNVKYLYRMLGTTDISTLGNGTITNALSVLNNNGIKSITRSGTTFTVTRNDNTTFTFNGKFEIPRVAKSCNYLPGGNTMVVEEYTAGTDYNLPSNTWYHIYTSQGSDTKYACQLALGMTGDAAYYRNYNNESWGSWHSLINTNTWKQNTNAQEGYVPKGVANKVWKCDASGNPAWRADANTTYGLASTSANGLLRQLNNNAGQFLCGQGTWKAPISLTEIGHITGKGSGNKLKFNPASYKIIILHGWVNDIGTTFIGLGSWVTGSQQRKYVTTGGYYTSTFPGIWMMFYIDTSGAYIIEVKGNGGDVANNATGFYAYGINWT